MTKTETILETIKYYSEDASRRVNGEYTLPLAEAYKIFLPKNAPHPPDFWAELQALKDSPQYWNENGLTPQGEAEAQRLLNKYQNK